MAKYLATQDIYFNNTGVYVTAGETFESDLPPGLAWDPLDASAEAAVAALPKQGSLDAPIPDKGAK